MDEATMPGSMQDRACLSSDELFSLLIRHPVNLPMTSMLIPLLRVCWLPVASFFAGVLNTIAGGGSFISLPALLVSTASVGVGAVTAQATNTVALWPGQLTSLVAFRQQLRAYG